MSKLCQVPFAAFVRVAERCAGLSIGRDGGHTGLQAYLLMNHGRACFDVALGRGVLGLATVT